MHAHPPSTRLHDALHLERDMVGPSFRAFPRQPRPLLEQEASLEDAKEAGFAGSVTAAHASHCIYTPDPKPLIFKARRQSTTPGEEDGAAPISSEPFPDSPDPCLDSPALKVLRKRALLAVSFTRFRKCFSWLAAALPSSSSLPMPTVGMICASWRV